MTVELVIISFYVEGLAMLEQTLEMADEDNHIPATNKIHLEIKAANSLTNNEARRRLLSWKRTTFHRRNSEK